MDNHETEHRAVKLMVKDLRKRERLIDLKISVVLSLLFVFMFIFSMLMGRYHCSKWDLFYAFLHGSMERLLAFFHLSDKLNPVSVTWAKDIETVVWTIRFPRIIAVVFIGGGLSVAGACYQSIFRNPLVSEGILGVSNGASLGAVIAIFLGLNSFLISGFAFCGGILAVGMTYFCSKAFKGNPTLLLVLAGTVVGSLLTAGTSIVKYIAPPDSKLPEIVFWMMGSFSGITMAKISLMVPLIFVCFTGILCMRWQLNIMALGDDEAKALGVNTSLYRTLLIILSTVITAAAVCVCGIVGWVGMVIPQITRLIVGPDARRLIPSAFFVGAIFLMIVDVACRTVTTNEIPVGIVTSLVGAPIFLLLLRRVKEGWA